MVLDIDESCQDYAYACPVNSLGMLIGTISTLLTLGTIKMNTAFKGNGKGITHHNIVDGNSDAIIHYLSPVLDVKNAKLDIVHIHYS